MIMPKKSPKPSKSESLQKDLELKKLKLEVRQLSRAKYYNVGALGVSVIALVLSFIGYYNSNVKVEHEVQVSMFRKSLPNVLQTIELTGLPNLSIISEWVFLANRGNQSETITDISISLAFEQKKDSDDVESPAFLGRSARLLWSTSQPNLLAPSEVLHKQVEFDLSFLRLEYNKQKVFDGAKVEYPLLLRVGYLNQAGYYSVAPVYLGSIKLYEAKNEMKVDVNFRGASFDLFDRTEEFYNQVLNSMPGT